ncbi:DUF2157 domain-containing protein [Pontibacillus yanchengensis]|uniref:DUF2157 domain-containing protein n=1 Tax=Pontibacillus yanchengensis Y32 TaxID=1385514 RepID=A0A0A2T973_9BACI|nr:DUF2157 domain-containing protein [Pontibacillus yanchengensis]KGP72114.1 hypothetical protein N782_13845 [Pontibacillus yanchengensis Y32]
MKHNQIQKEAKKWVEEGIISSEQYTAILSRYPKHDQRFLLMAFGGLFVGLGFLTFIASNWSDLTNAIKMVIILVAMIGFYGVGERIYRKHSQGIGATFLVIGVLTFGAGIILTGQMYHYMAYSATAFFIWSLAAIAIFILSQEAIMLVLAFGIITIGQIYGGFTYQDFHIGLGLLFLIGLGYFTYIHQREWISTLYAIGFVLQSLVLVLTSDLSYYWLFAFLLLLYSLSEIVPKDFPVQAFKRLAVAVAFLIGIIQVFTLQSGWVMQDIELEISFLLLLIVLAGWVVYRNITTHSLSGLVDLALFVPVFLLPDFKSAFVLVLLFIFSLGRLLLGYKDGDAEMINIGTIAFLVSTLVAYFQVAWDFLDKSVFFFIGGVLLFVLGYLLERRRRAFSRAEERGDRL